MLSDRMSPGWWATIDDGFTMVATADYLFRAVVVPPGKHKVVWKYTAPGFEAGAWFSAILAALLMAGSFVKR